MKRMLARDLLKYSTAELWEILTGDFTLVFEDGELQTNARETLYSSYSWDFHRKYEQTPLRMKHHLKHVLGSQRLGSDTHLELLGNAMWSVYDTYVAGDVDYMTTGAVSEFPLQLRDRLSEMVYQQTNAMYNDLSYRLEEYVVSLDITDFMDVLAHPRVKAANDRVQPNQKSIDDTYAEIKDVLVSGVELPRNPLSLAVRSKLGNINQVLQCVAPRGYLTDTDSNIFRVPVLRGFAQGIRRMHDSMIESRSAAKSLIFSKSPLQQAEYFSRRLQLMSQIVKNLHPGDCGTTEFLYWKVRGPVIKDGTISHGGDLKQLTGKYYLDDDNKLKIIRSSDKFLVGRKLRVRSAIHCAHPDPYGICATCFGELALSVPADTNIGHMCCTSMTQKSSQNVLSVKHLDGSSVVEGITLGPEDRNFLKVGVDENSYMLAESLKGRKVMLVIPASRATNITDIVEIKNVEDLNITRVSELEEIGIRVPDGLVPLKADIFVHIGRRLASMTYPLLRHIREHGWGVDEFTGDYTVDMTGWDWTKPILALPLKHINMSDHSRDIAELLESSVDELQERDKMVSPDAILAELYDLVNDKLSVNLAVLEVILYGSMIVSAEKGDYSLPKPWTTRGLGVMSLSMANRSMSVGMAYEGHRDLIVAPESFVRTNRADHPMDGILCPGEVFENATRI